MVLEKLIQYNDVKDTQAEEYFKGNKLAVDVFNAKYSFDKKDGTKETPAEVFWRVASGLAAIETDKEKEKYYRDRWFSLLWEGWFRPGGSVLSGVGNPKKVSLINCTHIPLKEDSISGIIEKCEYELARCAAKRQGIGVDMTVLRPRGSSINNAAEESEGIVSWATKYSEIGRFVGQKGRMPALLISLDVSHPDIYEFVTSKTNLDTIVNANISVQIGNAFIDAVKNNEEWELRFDFKAGDREPIVKTVNAVELFDLIAKTAAETAEPGVQYIDLMREGSMVHQVYEATGDEKFKIVGTNAPVVGDSLVYTNTGVYKIEELYKKGKANVLVDTKHTKSMGSNSLGEVSFAEATFIKYDNQPEYKITLSNGVELSCNDKHKWLTQEGYVETQKLSTGDKIMLPSDGIWSASLTEEEKSSENYASGVLAGQFIGGTSIDLSLLQKIVRDGDVDTWLDKNGINAVNRRVPNRCFVDRLFGAGFLAGLIGSIGKVSSKGNIKLSVVSYTMPKYIQLLAAAFGINAVKSCNKRCGHTIRIEDLISKRRLVTRISISDDTKLNKIVNYVNKTDSEDLDWSASVVGIQQTGAYKTMYCGVVPKIHGLVIDGVLSSNCSEKPLAGYSVCNLSSINMAKFSTNPEEYKKEMDIIIPLITRMADNVVDYEIVHNKYPLPQQKDMLEFNRELGMGITNMHGWFLNQDLAYDDEKSIEVAEKFFSYYAYKVFETSVEIGKEKGNASAWDLVDDKTVFMKSVYFNNIVNKFYGSDVSKVGTMRNLAHMSIAPTGSLSLVFPEPVLSTGVEPTFAACYWKKTRAVQKGTYLAYFQVPEIIRSYVLSKLDKNSEEYATLSEFPGSVEDNSGEVGDKIKEIINNTLPKGFFKAAHKIDPYRKIALMGALYKWVDAAVSCTYNLPEGTGPDVVKKLYMEAFDSGIRAISVYIDGTREGILLTENPKTYAKKFEKKKQKCADNERPLGIVPNCAPKRPRDLPCDIHFTSIQGNMWVVLVGLLDGKPYEIFAGEMEDLYLPKSCKNGIIKKQGNGKYALEVTIRRSPVIYKDIANILMDDDQKAMTRLLSLSMRHGVCPRYIVDQLRKSNGAITAFSTAIARVMSKYTGTYDLKDGENKCPLCGENSLMFVEGCIKCINEECNYSRCG